MTTNQLTTIQITKKTLRKVRAYCRRNGFIQRYWVEDVLLRWIVGKKARGAANRNRSPE